MIEWIFRNISSWSVVIIQLCSIDPMHFLTPDNQMKHHQLHSGPLSGNSIQTVLKYLEEIDEIGEDILTELNEETIESNPGLIYQMATSTMTTTDSSSYGEG